MAAFFTSFGYGLLLFWPEALWNMPEKLCQKKLSSKNDEILYRSSQDKYQQRKKPEVTSSNSKDAIFKYITGVSGPDIII